MEILKVYGNNRECGEQIGYAFQKQIKTALDEARSDKSAGFNWEEAVLMAQHYWKATETHYPTIIEELVGIGTGANINPNELFTYMVEELWSSPSQINKACTDIILTAPITDGRVLVGHNNDLSPSLLDKVFPVEWKFTNGMSLFTVGPLGFYVSAGINSYGLALTGNELTPVDNKPGVPRSIIAKAILGAKNPDEATKIATNPDRASSYNNIVSNRNEVIDIEGSATKYELLLPGNGFIVHANHYTSPFMQEFEGHPNYTSSYERQNRAEELVTQYRERIGLAELKKFLQDHKNGQGDDNTICRHGDKSQTVFSLVIDFEEKIVELAMGNPCQNSFEKVWDF